MGKRIAIFLIAIGLSSAWGAPVDLSPPTNALGAADSYGYLRIWREIDEVDFGDGLKLPVRVEFSTEHDTASPYLGQGWWLPLLEARAYLKRPEMMYATLLCGKSMYLRRSKDDPSRFSTLDNQWTGVLDGESFTISRKDGWQLLYKQGHLTQLKTDTGRIIAWITKGNTVVELREEAKGNSPFVVNVDSSGVPNGFTVNGKIHSFTMDKKPHVIEVQRQRLVASLDPSLASWRYPDGKQETFQFAVDPSAMVPNLTFTDSKKQVSVFTWDPVTKKIASEGDWKYQIAVPKDALDVPELKRVNSKGQNEFLIINEKLGTTEFKSLDGKHTITYAYNTVGPLYDKIRKVESIDGRGVHTVSYSAAYDEAGRLIRQTRQDGWTYTYSYDSAGKITKRDVLDTRSPDVLKSLADQQKVLELAVAEAMQLGQDPDAKIKKLCYFYIFQMKDPAKALVMANSQVMSVAAKFLIKLQAVNHSDRLTLAQKLEGYKALLQEFPQNQGLLNMLIKDAQNDLDRGEQ